MAHLAPIRFCALGGLTLADVRAIAAQACVTPGVPQGVRHTNFDDTHEVTPAFCCACLHMLLLIQGPDGAVQQTSISRYSFPNNGSSAILLQANHTLPASLWQNVTETSNRQLSNATVIRYPFPSNPAPSCASNTSFRQLPKMYNDSNGVWCAFLLPSCCQLYSS